MTKEKDALMNKDETTGRKHRNLRLKIGITLILLAVAFTLIVTITMRQRIEAADEAAKPLLWRGLQNDLIVCTGLLIVTIGFTFDFLTKSRLKGVRILGYVIFGIGVLIAAEALFMSGRIVIRDMKRDAAPEAPYVVVLGTELGEGNTATLDLSARLDTALTWWKDHPDTTLVVTGGGEATKAKAAKYQTRGASTSNKRKSAVDTIGSLMADRVTVVLMERAGLVIDESMEAEDSKASKRKEEFKNQAEAMIVKVGQSETAEEAFANLLTQRGFETDTLIVLVTNNYDMEEAVLAAEAAGFTNVTRLPAPSDFWQYGTNVLWEVWKEYDPAVSPAADAA